MPIEASIPIEAPRDEQRCPQGPAYPWRHMMTTCVDPLWNNCSQRNIIDAEILRPDSYGARKTITTQRKDSSESSYGQSYAHVKVPHATYMLGTPLTSLRLPNNYAFAPLWHNEAAKGALCATEEKPFCLSF